MKVQVTREHINAGRSHCRHCPISLALRDVGLDGPEVWGGRIQAVVHLVIFVEHEWKGITLELPKEVGAFMSDFDKGQNVLPFEFDFDFPGGAPLTTPATAPPVGQGTSS